MSASLVGSEMCIRDRELLVLELAMGFAKGPGELQVLALGQGAGEHVRPLLGLLRVAPLDADFG
eukprot:5662181-Alexandrium_andersonii.AAC.1